ncbi:MAG TPA: 5-oxoprolinase subunit PxpA, partial [Thermoanaerobaculia bacterium]|nr:5-oxoprolinase subunit PxpA [Thermoanaerobaculia bacterium]
CHAGDPSTMDETVALALAHGVCVGAHPGYPDRANFGRRKMEMPADAIERLVLYQVAALEGFVRSRGSALTHVKPHGALYHSAAEFPDVARAVAEGVRRFGSSLILVGPGGSMLLEAGRDAGLPVAAEGFADRRYQPDGTLVARGEPDALLTDPDEAAEQAVTLGRDGFACARGGSWVAVRADTICLHGDTPGAASIARRIRERFREEGIAIMPLSMQAQLAGAAASVRLA